MEGRWREGEKEEVSFLPQRKKRGRDWRRRLPADRTKTMSRFARSLSLCVFITQGERANQSAMLLSTPRARQWEPELARESGRESAMIESSNVSWTFCRRREQSMALTRAAFAPFPLRWFSLQAS